MVSIKKILFTALITSFIRSSASAQRVDITLSEGIRLALERNFSIEESAADLDSAYWALREARCNADPTFG